MQKPTASQRRLLRSDGRQLFDGLRNAPLLVEGQPPFTSQSSVAGRHGALCSGLDVRGTINRMSDALYAGDIRDEALLPLRSKELFFTPKRVSSGSQPPAPPELGIRIGLAGRFPAPEPRPRWFGTAQARSGFMIHCPCWTT